MATLGANMLEEVDRKVLKAILSFVSAEAIVYACGLPVLANFLATNGMPSDAATVLSLGFTPFIVGDLIKALLAGALLPLTWKLVNRTSA